MAIVDAMSAALAEDRAQRTSGPHIGLEQHTWRVVLDIATRGAIRARDQAQAREALLQVVLVAAAAADQVTDLVPTPEEQQ